MFLSGLQTNLNIIQPIPRFNTIRFGRRKEIDDGENNDQNREYKINDFSQPAGVTVVDINHSTILLTDIRKRDWNFYDDPQEVIEKNLPNVKYQLVPTIINTIKNRSMNLNNDNNANQYEEYDLDEQDLQWLIAYNQFCIDKNLPELDENVFEYIIQTLEHQCLLAIRQKNFADTIQCDACHRVDDVDDLIQCTQCKTIVHKKCYGIETNPPWICHSCQYDTNQHFCCLCDKSGGALKLLKSLINEERWIHLSCAFWVPKIDFDEQMTPILTDTLKFDGQCLICNKSNGLKINCSWKNCQNQFHAICGINTGRDMLIAENDERTSVRLLALCHRHSEKLDPAEKRLRMNKVEEIKQKRFEQFETYIDLESIKTETSIPPEILESVHAYWVLKRQTNNCRPLSVIPDDIFYHGFDKNINLEEFSQQYHLEHQEQTTDFIEEKPNVLQFLTTNMVIPSLIHKNFFMRFAQRKRIYFTDYERNLFCLIDMDKKKTDSLLERMLSSKTSL